MGDDTGTLHSGWITKVGAVRKNWKLRWIVLRKDGMLHYYKRQCKYGECPVQGSLNVQSDALGLIEFDLVNRKNLVKWPANCPEGAGFAIRMRNGRIFFMYCECKEACTRWLKAIRSVGANIVLDDEQIARMVAESTAESSDGVAVMNDEEKFGFDFDSEDEEGPADEGIKATLPDASLPKEEGKVYVHKVVGGMVVRQEVETTK